MCTTISVCAYILYTCIQGHIILGQGDLTFQLNNDISTIGTIEDVAASPNDPMFILHHNMIDCIFIEWMRRYPDAQYPSNVATIGHARDGFILFHSFRSTLMIIYLPHQRNLATAVICLEVLYLLPILWAYPEVL